MPTIRTATLRRDIRGQFGTWPKGERVSTVDTSNVRVTIERIDKQDRTTINNMMCNVPTDALEFDE